MVRGRGKEAGTIVIQWQSRILTDEVRMSTSVWVTYADGSLSISSFVLLLATQPCSKFINL